MEIIETDKIRDCVAELLNQRLRAVTACGLQIQLVDFEYDPEQKVKYVLYVSGEIRTHPVGPDPDGDGLEYNYVPVDQTTDVVLEARASVEEFVQATEYALAEITNAVLEGREILETQLHLSYQIDHQ